MNNRTTKIGAKLYIDDSNVLQGKGLGKELTEKWIEKARNLSVEFGGVVELRVVLCYGSLGRDDYIKAWDDWLLRVFDNGKEIHREDMDSEE